MTFYRSECQHVLLSKAEGRNGTDPETVMTEKKDVLQGTLDLLILKALSLEAMHGWGVAQRIQQISRDVLQVNQGSLYPALHRLEHRGWIAASWGTSENNRRAKYYRLTATGRKQLAAEEASWREFSRAVELVLAAG